MLKETRMTNEVLLPLGNGFTRIYLDNKEIIDEFGATHYESSYLELPELNYEAIVHALIRDKYTLSEEFSILRQRDEKILEFAAYNSYCEECKMKSKTVCASLGI